MTCIVGLVTPKGIYVGGDSAGVGGYSLTVRADEKVFINGGFIFGFTSSFRMGQILRFGFTPPKLHADVDLYEYMVTTFIDAVRQRFAAAGWIGKEETTRDTGGTFIVGHRNRLFTIQGDFQVAESIDGYDAVGCGQDIALGSLYATKKSDGFSDPEVAVETALEAAEGYSAGVRRPFKILLLEHEQPVPKTSRRNASAR
jgi:hypothetical protein